MPPWPINKFEKSFNKYFLFIKEKYISPRKKEKEAIKLKMIPILKKYKIKINETIDDIIVPE